MSFDSRRKIEGDQTGNLIPRQAFPSRSLWTGYMGDGPVSSHAGRVWPKGAMPRIYADLRVKTLVALGNSSIGEKNPEG